MKDEHAAILVLGGIGGIISLFLPWISAGGEQFSFVEIFSTLWIAGTLSSLFGGSGMSIVEQGALVIVMFGTIVASVMLIVVGSSRFVTPMHDELKYYRYIGVAMYGISAIIVVYVLFDMTYANTVTGPSGGTSNGNILEILGYGIYIFLVVPVILVISEFALGEEREYMMID